MSFRNSEDPFYLYSLLSMKVRFALNQGKAPYKDSTKNLSGFGKASFCTSFGQRKREGGSCERRFKVPSGRQGSLTVECALVLFLFFLGTVTLISFMDIYRVQVQRQSQLRERVEELGMLRSFGESGAEEVQLPDVYLWSPAVSFVSLPPVVLTGSVKVHAWTGYSGEEQGQGQAEEMVYVAQTGSVYHRSPDCSYLALSIEAVSREDLPRRRNEDGGSYSPCERCIREGQIPSSVYITGSGDRYHSQITCSGLKRTVRMVERSEVAGWRACSRCG